MAIHGTLLSGFLGLITHPILNRSEPNALLFVLGLLICMHTLALVQWIQGCSLMDAISSSVVFLLVYLFVLALSISLYRLSPWHPLAKYPGPRLAHLTKWWMVNQLVFRGGRHTKLQELHSLHGSWVRVGPNDISVSLPSAIRPIYNRLDRAQFYQGAPFSAEALITVLDRDTHRKRRQPWVDALSSDGLAAYLPMIHARIMQLIRILEEQSAEGQTVKLDYWTYLFFLDTMGDIGFSGGFESMKAGADTEGWLYTLAMGVFLASTLGQIPWLKDILNLVPRRGPIESFHRAMERKIAQINSNHKENDKRLAILDFLLDSSVEHKLNRAEVIADAALIVVAATDTSVQAVITIFRYLALDPERQSRLAKEVASILTDAVDDGGDSLTSTLCHLPYLEACVQESLRILPPGPFGPVRTTGSSGAIICGEYIPPNTTIHVPVYAMHRDPTNFGVRAEEFVPERWLENDPLQQALNLPAIKPTSFMPFGAGFGACIGKNLAIQNVKLLVAHIVHNFEVACPSEFNTKQFDRSYKEFGIWQHDAFPVILTKRKAM
ncbi:cytochrome P450 [Mycena filopes]|nr:cytochrome P450 [Mycena filopes]